MLDLYSVLNVLLKSPTNIRKMLKFVMMDVCMRVHLCLLLFHAKSADFKLRTLISGDLK